MTITKLSLKRTSLGLLAVSLVNLAASYLREIVMAMFFGTGAVTDAFTGSYSFIMSLNDLTLGAMLSASIVPAFTNLPDDLNDHESWQSLMTSLALILLTVTGLLTLAVYGFYPFILHILFPGFDENTRDIALSLGRHIVLLLPLQALLLLFTLTLNVRHHYLLPASAYLIINVVFSSMIAVLHNRLGQEVMPAAVLSGTGAAVAMLAWRLRRLGGLRSIKMYAPGLRKVWRLSRPMLMSLGLGSSIGLLMASHLVIRHYASYLGEGAVAALGFGFRIYEVPLTVIATTAATLVLPAFSRMHLSSDKERMAHICREMILWGWVLLLPVAAIFYTHAAPIVALLLERGKFNAASTELTAHALEGFAPAVIFEAGFVVFFRVFYAMHRGDIPVIIGIATMAVLLVLLQCLPVENLRDISFCLSAAFAFSCIIVLASAWRLLGTGIFPPPAALLAPLLVMLALTAIWKSYLPPHPQFFMAVLSPIGYGCCYVACLWILMPGQRRQCLQFLHG